MASDKKPKFIIQTATLGNLLFVKLNDLKIYQIGFPTDEEKLPTEFLLKTVEVKFTMEQITKKAASDFEHHEPYGNDGDGVA